MSQSPGAPATSGRFGGLGPRTIAGIVLAVLVLLFIVVNRERTKISFIFFTAQTALWVALTLSAAGGFLAGFLIGRRRYRS